MSADNWGICPRCHKKYMKERDSLYGKVGEQEYLSKKEELERRLKADSMREDYEIGINVSGRFYINYYASCECGFRYTFKIEKNVFEDQLI